MNAMEPSTYGLAKEQNIRGSAPNNHGSGKNNRSMAPSKSANHRGYCTRHRSQKEADWDCNERRLANSPSCPILHNSDDSVTGHHNWRFPCRYMWSSSPRCGSPCTRRYVPRYTPSFRPSAPPSATPLPQEPSAQSPRGSAPKPEALPRGHHCEHSQLLCNSLSSESYSNDSSLERCATMPPSLGSPHDSLPAHQQIQLA